MHDGHDHDLPGQANGGTAGIGHNHPAPRALQWQRAHGGKETATPTRTEPDLDLVEAAFTEGFFGASDPTSFLRLAQVPFEATSVDGKKLALLRVEIDAVTDVGGITPHLGGTSFRYDPLPARMVSRRKQLRFVYFDGQGQQSLTLDEVRGLSSLLVSS